MIFYIEIPMARNFLGLLIGSGFSPTFTTESFRWPLTIALFVLAISAHREFESRAMLEKIRSKHEEN
jgi:hypothetical protein